MFKEYYNRRFQEILGSSPHPLEGLGDDVVQAKMLECKLTLPKALFDYYALAGEHPINTVHNQLLPIEQIRLINSKLIFMEENQCVVYWAIDQADINSPNPIVWQGINGDIVAWHEEPYKLNQFLMAMWNWTMTEEQEAAEN